MSATRRRPFVLAAILALAALAGLWAGARLLGPQAPEPLATGTRLEPPRALPDVALLDQSGGDFHPADLAGRWTFLFFGFTHCPEACPTTLALLASVRKTLEARLPDGPVPDVGLVSVDPERDSAAVLKQYLVGFDPAFRGFTGTPAAVRTFATGLGVPYRKTPMPDGDYMMDHSTAILLIDPDGRLAAIFQAPQTLDGLVADFVRVAGGR